MGMSCCFWKFSLAKKKWLGGSSTYIYTYIYMEVRHMVKILNGLFCLLVKVNLSAVMDRSKPSRQKLFLR